MQNHFSKQIFKHVAVVGLSVSILFLAFGPIGGSTQSVSQPKQAHAESMTSAIGKGVGKGLTMCLGNLVSQFLIPQSVGKVAGLSFVNPAGAVPVISVGTNIGQGQQAFTKFIREGCLDAIAFFTAKSTLNKLSEDTLAWVNSGFRKFGRPGNKAYVGDMEGFLSGVKDTAYNRFLQNIQNTTGLRNPLRGVCESFQPEVVRSVSSRYFQRNQEPSGVQPALASSSVARGCNQLTNAIGTSSVEDFVSGDFSEGGWEAFAHTLENPKANPVSAFLNQNRRLRNKTNQLADTKEQEIERSEGFLSVKTCPSGSLSTTTNRCVDANGNVVAEPETKTPGGVVNKQLNRVVGSGQRQLELADELNEIVAALTDQLVGKITGTGAQNGPGGVFSQAAQQSSVAGSPAGRSDSDEARGFQAGFAGDFASSTIAKQLETQLQLASLVDSLPTTNDLARTKTKAKQCIKNGKFDSPGKVQEVERLIGLVNNLESEVFPPVQGTRQTRDKEKILKQAREGNTNNQREAPQANGDNSQLTKIDWVGNETDWEYGKAKRQKNCSNFRDAYKVSFIPKRSSGRWEPFICVPADSTAFNETRTGFNGTFIPLPKTLQKKLSVDSPKVVHDFTGDGVGIKLGTELSLYRTEKRQGKVKVDWTGAKFDWKHYYPLVKFSSWPKEDTIAPKKDNNHSNKTFLKTGLIDTPGPNLGQGEAEKLKETGSGNRKQNRYGTKVCDNRTLGDNSFIVKPHDNVWTIQKCAMFRKSLFDINAPETKMPEGDHYRFIDVNRLIDIIKNGPENVLVSIQKAGSGFEPAEVSDITDATSTSQVITEYINGNKPEAFKVVSKQPDSFSSYLTSINNLIGDNNTGESPTNQFTAPPNEPDNLRELLYDFRTINYQPGDVNSDGLINSADVSKLNNFLDGETNLSVSQQEAADVDGDDNIQQDDVGLIQDYVNGDENALPTRSANTADRKQLLDQRFGRIKGRYVWADEGDIAAVKAAREELTASSTDNATSSIEALQSINENNNCQLPTDWEPPVSDGSDDDENDDGDNEDTTIIDNFTVNRVGTRKRRIRIQWNTNANQCTASNNRGLTNWEGPVANPRGGVTSLRSQQSVRFTLQCTKNGQTANVVRNVGRSDINFDPRNQESF